VTKKFSGNTGCPKKVVPYLIFAQCVESGVSCTDFYRISLLLIEIPAVPVGTKFSRWRPPNNRGPKKNF
jgi:hypothetical protein